MSKGSTRRPQQISAEEMKKRWTDAFGTDKPQPNADVCEACGEVHPVGFLRRHRAVNPKRRKK